MGRKWPGSVPHSHTIPRRCVRAGETRVRLPLRAPRWHRRMAKSRTVPCRRSSVQSGKVSGVASSKAFTRSGFAYNVRIAWSAAGLSASHAGVGGVTNTPTHHMATRARHVRQRRRPPPLDHRVAGAHHCLHPRKRPARTSAAARCDDRSLVFRHNFSSGAFMASSAAGPKCRKMLLKNNGVVRPTRSACAFSWATNASARSQNAGLNTRV